MPTRSRACGRRRRAGGGAKINRRIPNQHVPPLTHFHAPTPANTSRPSTPQNPPLHLHSTPHTPHLHPHGQQPPRRLLHPLVKLAVAQPHALVQADHGVAVREGLLGRRKKRGAGAGSGRRVVNSAAGAGAGPAPCGRQQAGSKLRPILHVCTRVAVTPSPCVWGRRPARRRGAPGRCGPGTVPRSPLAAARRSCRAHTTAPARAAPVGAAPAAAAAWRPCRAALRGSRRGGRGRRARRGRQPGRPNRPQPTTDGTDPKPRVPTPHLGCGTWGATCPAAAPAPPAPAGVACRCEALLPADARRPWRRPAAAAPPAAAAAVRAWRSLWALVLGLAALPVDAGLPGARSRVQGWVQACLG